ncbi:hypothetical protein BEP19_06435 [Ammoniphilus oxalaticus]|uniref:Uncharacterized protein n=1 Tax=Ammoniphilus oxalaticus TaxID=66863 RepID=A0A419SJB0_9BACL|nr:group-specific protein [Ammoniphilus oxalaticus]RKD24042.1 hypothetical protein BEP19_06435 [Ammoniphilus oxalaticus]
MGCMMDHPLSDVKQKLEAVQEKLEKSLVERLAHSFETTSWEQGSLNEMFHALKKLEKNRSESEQKQVIEGIQSILTNQS